MSRVCRRPGLIGSLALIVALLNPGGTLAADPTPTPAPQGVGATAQTGTRTGSVSSVRTSTVLPDRYPSGAGGAPAEEVDEGKHPVAPVDPGAVIGSPSTAPSVLVAPGAQGGTSALVFTQEPTTVILKKSGQPGAVSELAEPQVATQGDRWFVTWNWFAGQSFDGGQTFRWLDPNDGFPGKFCCDQLAAHLPAQDLWVWVRQGDTKATGEDEGGGTGVLRLSTAQGPDAFDSATFRHFDFTAQDFGYEDTVWLDQPRLGWSDDHLFLTANAYLPVSEEDNKFVGAAAWRIPLADLVADENNVSLSWFATGGDHPMRDAGGTPLFSLAPVPDAGSTMFLAAHDSTSTLAVVAWPDDSDSFSLRRATTVDSDGTPVAYRALSSDYAACPVQGTAMGDWCHGVDERITSAWRRGSDVGWAWTIPQDALHAYPSVWAVEIDPVQLDDCTDSACISSWTELTFADAAAAYPAFAANDRGDLGGVVLVGGGTYKPSCYAVSRAADARDTDPWQLLRIVASDVDSSRDRWGDYLGVTTEAGRPSWTGACMSLHADGINGVHVARFAPSDTQ